MLLPTDAIATVSADPAGLRHLGQAMLGTWEIIAILAVVVLLFGGAKLPQLGKGLGEAIGNFKRAQKEGEQQALGGTRPDALRAEIDATPRIDVSAQSNAAPRPDSTPK